MATVEYTALVFKEPAEKITERQYAYIKQELIKDKDFKFYTPSPYWPFMKLNYIVLSASALIAWICYKIVLGGEPPTNETVKDVVTATLMLTGFVAFYMSYNVSGKHTSYMKYKGDLNNYFDRMKAAILETNSYEGFVTKFYKTDSKQLSI